MFTTNWISSCQLSRTWSACCCTLGLALWLAATNSNAQPMRAEDFLQTCDDFPSCANPPEDKCTFATEWTVCFDYYFLLVCWKRNCEVNPLVVNLIVYQRTYQPAPNDWALVTINYYLGDGIEPPLASLLDGFGVGSLFQEIVEAEDCFSWNGEDRLGLITGNVIAALSDADENEVLGYCEPDACQSMNSTCDGNDPGPPPWWLPEGTEPDENGDWPPAPPEALRVRFEDGDGVVTINAGGPDGPVITQGAGGTVIITNDTPYPDGTTVTTDTDGDGPIPPSTGPVPPSPGTIDVDSEGNPVVTGDDGTPPPSGDDNPDPPDPTPPDAPGDNGDIVSQLQAMRNELYNYAGLGITYDVWNTDRLLANDDSNATLIRNTINLADNAQRNRDQHRDDLLEDIKSDLEAGNATLEETVEGILSAIAAIEALEDSAGEFSAAEIAKMEEQRVLLADILAAVVQMDFEVPQDSDNLEDIAANTQLTSELLTEILAHDQESNALTNDRLTSILAVLEESQDTHEDILAALGNPGTVSVDLSPVTGGTAGTYTSGNSSGFATNLIDMGQGVIDGKRSEFEDNAESFLDVQVAEMQSRLADIQGELFGGFASGATGDYVFYVPLGSVPGGYFEDAEIDFGSGTLQTFRIYFRGLLLGWLAIFVVLRCIRSLMGKNEGVV